MSGRQQPAIIHAPSPPPSKEKTTFWELEAQVIKGLIGLDDVTNKKKKHKTQTFNMFNADPDFENCNGWSLTVTRKNLHALKGSHMGLFMVNLTKGSMMGPHWNPIASEIAIVVQGRGMIRVVCSSTKKEPGCQNQRFRVQEGDVFVVPRFHPMAQMSFNNDSFVFIGFSTSTKKNHPQYLAGKASVYQTLDKQIVAASFNVSNTTVIDQLLAPQGESIILDCTSCAEAEEIALEQEIEKAKEEARKKKEEQARKREEEERREEEEKARKREEEKRREEEEARKREEEEARKREEERRRRQEEEEEEARKRKEEEEEEEERKRQREQEEEEEAEEEARRREEEEERRRQEEAAAEEEAARRQEEEARRREEEEERRRQEEAAAEEEAARRQEEEAERRRQEEAAAEEEAARRQEEEARREAAEEEEERGGGGGRGSGKPRIVLRKIWRI